MAETLISPGVLARENDASFISRQPIAAGAAIIGPTVKGPVNKPTLISTYSDYQNKFGTVLVSGSDTYTYFKSIAACVLIEIGLFKSDVLFTFPKSISIFDKLIDPV